MLTYIFDTFALASYFLGEEPGKRVRDLMKKLEKKREKAFLCEINLGELYYALFRKKGQAMAEEAVEDVKTLPVTLVQVEWDLILSAARIKATKPISFADAFVAALAQEKEGTIVTHDPEFKVLEKEVEILWL